MSPYFEYELTSFPTSLFKENFMRKAVKAQLAKSITDSVDCSEYRRPVLKVLDRGAPLHRVKWGIKCHINKLHSSMCPVYGESMDRVVLFLMAMSRDSIKNLEHLRHVKKVCADIQLNESMEAYRNQEVKGINISSYH